MAFLLVLCNKDQNLLGNTWHTQRQHESQLSYFPVETGVTLHSDDLGWAEAKGEAASHGCKGGIPAAPVQGASAAFSALDPR